MKYSSEYMTWMGIKNRCLNPAAPEYPNYGGRGITVCDAWRDNFAAFLADMGRKPSPQHSIDRIDNNLGYSASNCRWATKAEQSRNRRNVILVTFNGETRCASEWARMSGLTPWCLLYRLRSGWAIERALTTPPLRPRH